MKKTLKIVAVLMCAVSLLGMSGCFLKNPRLAYYFHTFDELSDCITEYYDVRYLNPQFYVRTPEDNRFVDSAYIIYQTGHGGIANLYSLTAFKLEIDGEVIYLFGVHSYDAYREIYLDEFNPELTWVPEFSRFITLEGMKNPIDLSLKYDENGKLANYYDCMVIRELFAKLNGEFSDEYSPKNSFVKEFLNLSEKKADRLVNSCKWYGCDRRGIEYEFESLGYVWGVYDTRDVSQSEKDALALELMEILYNNYKLAGEMAE